MTESGEPAPPVYTSQLEYAPQPAVGDVAMTRVGDVTVVTLRRSWRRVGRVLAAAALAIGPLAGLAAAGSLIPRWSVVPPIGAGIALLIYSTLIVGSADRALVIAANPVRWTVTPAGISSTCRQPMQVVVSEYPRANLADVRVERVRLKNEPFKRPGLVTINPAGLRIVHARGTRAELAFMAEAFRDGLGIGPDPLVEAAYPPEPRRSQVDRRIGMRGVAVTLRPRRLGWTGIVVIAATLALAMFGIQLVLQVPERRLVIPRVSMLACVVLVAALVAYCPLAALYNLRRRVTILVADAGVTLVEKALFRPGRETWPLDRVASLAVCDRHGGRRADLWLTLPDGRVATLISNGPGPEVRYAYQTLVVAMARLRSTPVLQG